jgi:hypothetical protein
METIEYILRGSFTYRVAHRDDRVFREFTGIEGLLQVPGNSCSRRRPEAEIYFQPPHGQARHP